MSYTFASALEIDKKLRDDFRRRLKDYGIASDITDPVLAVLFRTFAQQLEALYSETDRIRLALLDELIAGLGVEPRMARPAQTVLRFTAGDEAPLIAAGTELIGNAQTGERLTFITDTAFVASPARLAFAFTYQDGALRLLPGIELADSLQAARPSLEPVAASLGPNPAMFLAIENLPPQHLGRHSFFFELGPDAYRVQRALGSETWCLVGAEGELSGRGVLRPRAANAGVNALEWLVPPASSTARTGGTAEEAPPLPTGFYGPRLFVWPAVPNERNFTCRVPRQMDVGLGRIFSREAARVLDVPRAWVRISMPPDVPPLHTAIGGIVMHAMTASNVECLNQTVVFDKHGTSIPVVREEGGSASHLVAPLSIIGETGAPYVSSMQPSAKPDEGRYAIRNGRLELRPPLRADGRPEAHANVRLWVTSGSLGNNVGAGRVSGFLKQQSIPTLRVSNPTAATGGTDSESFTSARDRLADALLSRDRVVTHDDLLTVVRAFDSRITSANAASGVVRTAAGLQRAEHVTVTVNRDEFVDANAELQMLEDDLLRHLAGRFAPGTQVTVDVVS